MSLKYTCQLRNSFGLICFLLIAGQSLLAQSYQPFPAESATWKVARCWYFFQPGWHDTYTLTIDGSDTLYQGEVYKKIMMTEHLHHGVAFDSIYPTRFLGGLREEGKRIFIFQSWASVDTTAHLIYDFNYTNVGDTIYTSSLFGPASTMFPHVLTGIDSILIGSTYHKRLFLQDPGSPWLTEEWIEGVGSTWGLPFATVWSITDNSYDLTCFYRDGHLQYGNPSPSFGYCQPPYPTFACDSVLNSTSWLLPAQGNLRLFPNPTTDQVTLEWDGDLQSGTLVQIYSMIGQLLYSRDLMGNRIELQLGRLENGQYLVIVRAGNKVLTSPMVIHR